MKASFAMDSKKEMKAFKGLISKERWKVLVRIKIEAMIEAVLGVIDAQF